MSSNSPTTRPLPSFAKLDQLARQTGLIVRESKKFSAEGFLLSLLKAVTSGGGSFNQLADSLRRSERHAMARQSMSERIDDSASAFLISVVQEMVNQACDAPLQKLKINGINRVAVEDSSIHRLPKSNGEHFPAHGNASGPTAGVKTDLFYDLMSHQAIDYSLHGATEQDRSIGKDALAFLKKDDLILRDMGYFDLSEFAHIESKDAHWLTRLPLTTGASVIHKNDKEQPLVSFLKQTKNRVVDLRCRAGEASHPCRLVAIRASPQVAAQRRRDRREAARKKGKTPSQDALVRDGWHILITSLPASKASAADLGELYRVRWSIEIQFRAWKQSLNLGKALNRRSNHHHIECLVYAGLVWHLIGLKLGQIFARKVGALRLSFEKLYDVLAAEILEIMKLVQLERFAPDPRHIQRDKRARLSPMDQAFQPLT